MKRKLYDSVERQRAELLELSDRICDNPEIGLQEYKACGWLRDYLKKYGFQVEKGVGGLETSFRAEYCTDSGGPAIGLLCEYDALMGIGHGCGHHMQGPAILGAAVALRELELPGKIIVYGTPAEETFGGKIKMLENGCFRDIDIAFMMHATSTGTSVDTKTLALSSFNVKFKGRAAHAAVCPEKGRSALDALLLTFNAIEFLREHVPDDVRIHYSITAGTGPSNVVHETAEAVIELRSFQRGVLNEVILRFKKILEGAALMTETEYEVVEGAALDNAIRVKAISELLYENARLVDARDIRPPREKTGSTDFGNVLHRVPGACIRVASNGEIPAASHTKEAAAQGKSPESHQAVITAAKILAGASCDLIEKPELLVEIKREFSENLKATM